MFDTGVLIPITMFISIAVIINNVLKYRLQKRIIDTGQMDASVVKALLKPVGLSLDALKWGLLFFFGGLGLVVLEFLPYKPGHSSLPFGIEAICLSIGFLIYFLIARRDESQTRTL